MDSQIVQWRLPDKTHCEVMAGSHSRSVTKNRTAFWSKKTYFFAWCPESSDAQLSNDVYHGGGGVVWWKWVKIAIF